jgi:hypothetical protein
MGDHRPDLEALIRHFARKPTVPLPNQSDGLIREWEGWRLYAINGLWADRPNREGDVVLVTPAGKSLHASWDVSSNGSRAVAFLDDPDLPLSLHFTAPVRDWVELAAEVFALVPDVAAHYGETASAKTESRT